MEKNNTGKHAGAEQPQQPSFFKEMGEFIRPYSGRYGVSVVFSVLGVLANLASYVFVGLIIGLIFSENAVLGDFLFLGGLAVGAKILNALLINFSTWISHRAAYMTLHDIRFAVVQKLKRLPLGYFESNGSGRLNTVLVDRIEGMEVTLAHVLPELTGNLLCPAALMVWMFFIDWRVALAVLIWIIVGFSLSSGMFKGYQEIYKGQIKAFKGMNQAIVEYVGGIDVIKNFGRGDSCYKKYEDAVYNHANYNVKWCRDTQKYAAAGMCMSPYPIFPVLVFGLIFFGQGSLDVPSFFMLIIQSLGIFRPLMVASSYFDRLAQMGTNAQEIRDVLDCREVERGDLEKVERFDVEYKGVCFKYEGKESEQLANKGGVTEENGRSDTKGGIAGEDECLATQGNVAGEDECLATQGNVAGDGKHALEGGRFATTGGDAGAGDSGKAALRDVSFAVNEGEMFALVGPSGGGKSTIAKLLAGYFDVCGGEITLGGRKLSSYSQNALNNAIAYVDQDTFLFNGTILDNIRLGKPDASDEEIINICKAAGCDDFIRALPDGYNTNTGECGKKLSGGERQRICIARAMAKNAPILILDEATSSSDPENEDKIQHAISAGCKGKTLIVVAHRLKTIVNADKIGFVKDGKITHIGTHKELLENCEDYKNMWIAGNNVAGNGEAENV